MRAFVLLSLSLLACTASAKVSLKSDAPPTTAAAPESVTAAAPPPERTVTFAQPTEKVGDRTLVRNTVGRSLLVRGEAGNGHTETELVTSHVHEATYEVLAAKDGVATKYKIGFSIEEEQRIHNGSLRRIVPVVAGKTYTIERTGGGVTVATDTKKAPSKKELSYFEHWAPALFDHGFRDAIGTQPMRVGASAPGLAKYFGSLLTRGGLGRARMNDVNVTLSGTRALDGEDCGVFSMVAHIVVERQGESIGFAEELELRGELLVRTRDGNAVQLLLEGPVRARVDSDGGRAWVDGSVRITSAMRTIN
jgi:hypothetical protein